jgi:uncharacterized phiE125 gp8 family phage protein
MRQEGLLQKHNLNHIKTGKENYMLTTILEQPSETVLSLEETKSHLRILNKNEDEYIKHLISAATNIIEKNTGKSILKKLYRYIVSPSALISSFSRIWIPISPLIEVKSVAKLIAQDKREDITDFVVESEDDDKYVKFQSSIYPVQVDFYSGMSETSESVPIDIKHAVLHVAQSIYDGNDEKILEIPYIKKIIKNYQDLSVV